MLKRLLFTLVAAASVLGIAATAYGSDYARSVDTTRIKPQVGTEQWVVLLCRFADSPAAPPFPMSDYDAAFNTHPKSHKNYFKEASYGQLKISAKIKNWRTIPARSSFSGSFSDRGEQFLFELYDACTQAHDSVTNFAAFQGIAMFFDDRELDVSDGTACQFGDTCTTNRTIGVSGYAYFDLRTKVLDGKNGFRAIWMATHESAHNEVTAHEMHHAYGAPHSYAGTDSISDTPEGNECWDPNQFRDVCGHDWDLMNAAWLGIPTDTHTLAATKVFHHKWITGPRRCNVITDITNQVFELERLSRPRDNNRCLAITIKHSSGNFGGTLNNWYVVEARFPVGFDADSSAMFGGGGIPGPAVLISRICIGTSPFCSPEPVVLGRDINGDFHIDEDSAEWQPGETFLNHDGKIKIKVVSKGEGFYTVRVARDSTP
jgi:M6 family metalloprotease-like protein